MSQKMLAVYCPRRGLTARIAYVTCVMEALGFDLVKKPITKEICGKNPCEIIVDEWPS